MNDYAAEQNEQRDAEQHGIRLLADREHSRLELRRKLLAREALTISTSFGEIQVKRVKNPDGSQRLIPEFEICRQIALKRNLPLRVVYETIAKEAAES